MTAKNQSDLNDEILNRLHNTQFKLENLFESSLSLTNNVPNNISTPFNISNDDYLKMISLKRQYMNEIDEALLSSM